MPRIPRDPHRLVDLVAQERQVALGEAQGELAAAFEFQRQRQFALPVHGETHRDGLEHLETGPLLLRQARHHLAQMTGERGDRRRHDLRIELEADLAAARRAEAERNRAVLRPRLSGEKDVEFRRRVGCVCHGEFLLRSAPTAPRIHLDAQRTL